MIFNHHQDHGDEAPGSWEQIAFFMAQACTWALSLFAVFGFAGYAYARWFA